MNEAFADILRQQVSEQSSSDAAHNDLLRAQQAKTADAQSRLLERIMPSRKTPEWPKEVLDIANALVAQPRLIPMVDAFLKKLVGAVNDAVEKALAEAMPK